MSTNALPPSLGPMYGSVYFGVLLSTAFYGVACMQTFFYHVHYGNDRLPTRVLVAILWVLTTIHEVLCAAGGYKHIMTGLANPFSSSVGNPELVLMNLLTALVAVPTQGFLVYRIYIFSKKNIVLPLIWVVLMPVGLVSCLIYVAKALYIEDGTIHAVSIGILDNSSSVLQATLALSLSAGIDVLIAIFMTFLLVRQRFAAKTTSTVHILQNLMVFSVNTGTWTATFAVLTALLLHLFPSNWICTVFMIPLCSVYCNTLLANLNARGYILDREMTHNVDLDLFSGPSSWVPDRTMQNNQHAEGKIVFATNPGPWEVTDVATSPDMSRSVTHTDG